MIGNSEDNYGLVARLLHWTMALLMIGLFGVGLWMTELPRGDFKGSVYGAHKAFGVLVGLLVVARLAWRLRNPVPRPEGTPLQQTAAVAMHWALYAAMVAIPLVGWLMSDTGGRPTSFFGLFTLPTLLGKNEPLHEALEAAHAVLSWSMILLVAGHAGAALWHHLVCRDSVLARMAWVRRPA